MEYGSNQTLVRATIHDVNRYEDDTGRGLTSCGLPVYPSDVTPSGDFTCLLCIRADTDTGEQREGMCAKACGMCRQCISQFAQDVINDLEAERDHYKRSLQDAAVGLQGPGSVSRVLKSMETALKGPGGK